MENITIKLKQIYDAVCLLGIPSKCLMVHPVWDKDGCATVDLSKLQDEGLLLGKTCIKQLNDYTDEFNCLIKTIKKLPEIPELLRKQVSITGSVLRSKTSIVRKYRKSLETEFRMDILARQDRYFKTEGTHGGQMAKLLRLEDQVQQIKQKTLEKLKDGAGSCIIEIDSDGTVK